MNKPAPIFKRIDYQKLNSRQKENFNFQKVSAFLADYGYVTLRLSDDWQGADFIAVHISGDQFLKVQLKGRLTVDKKYEKKGFGSASTIGTIGACVISFLMMTSCAGP